MQVVVSGVDPAKTVITVTRGQCASQPVRADATEKAPEAEKEPAKDVEPVNTTRETWPETVDRLRLEIVGDYKLPGALRASLEAMTSEDAVRERLANYRQAREQLIGIDRNLGRRYDWPKIAETAGRVALGNIPLSQAEDEYKGTTAKPEAEQIGSTADAKAGLIAGMRGV